MSQQYRNIQKQFPESGFQSEKVADLSIKKTETINIISVS